MEVKISANLPTGMKIFGHSIEVAIVGTALSSSFDSTVHLFSTPLTNFIGEFYQQQAILPIVLKGKSSTLGCDRCYALLIFMTALWRSSS